MWGYLTPVTPQGTVARPGATEATRPDPAEGTTMARRNLRFSRYPRRPEDGLRARCTNCGTPDVTMHPRRIGGGPPAMVCNGCTKRRREAKRLRQAAVRVGQ